MLVRALGCSRREGRLLLARCLKIPNVGAGLPTPKSLRAAREALTFRLAAGEGPSQTRTVPAGRYRISGAVAPLTVDRGASDTYTTDAAVFLKKRGSGPPPYEVANEYICAELARQLRLPVPASFVVELPGEESTPAFAALAFNLGGGRTPPIDPGVAVREEPELCTAVVLFDAWVVNTDRHAGNISFQVARPPHRLNVFDHSHALFRWSDSLTYCVNELGITGDRGNRHCLLNALPTAQYIPGWLERIARIPEYIVSEVLRDAVELGLPQQLAEDGARFLIDRRTRLPGIVAAHRGEFPAVTDWALI